MTELICIICPKSCNLLVDENDDYKMTGHGCHRGEEYGREELRNPIRVLTSTVRISGAIYNRCPVKTKAPIQKRFIFDAMRLLDGVELAAPVQEGQVVVEDICGSGIPWVTSRAMHLNPEF